MKKSLLAGAMALALTLGTSVPAFADPEVQVTEFEGGRVITYMNYNFHLDGSQFSTWQLLCLNGQECVQVDGDFANNNGLINGALWGAGAAALRRPDRHNNSTVVSNNSNSSSGATAIQSQGQSQDQDSLNFNSAEGGDALNFNVNNAEGGDASAGATAIADNVNIVDTDVSQNVNVDGSSGDGDHGDDDDHDDHDDEDDEDGGKG